MKNRKKIWKQHFSSKMDDRKRRSDLFIFSIFAYFKRKSLWTKLTNVQRRWRPERALFRSRSSFKYIKVFFSIRHELKRSQNLIQNLIRSRSELEPWERFIFVKIHPVFIFFFVKKNKEILKGICTTEHKSISLSFGRALDWQVVIVRNSLTKSLTFPIPSPILLLIKMPLILTGRGDGQTDGKMHGWDVPYTQG